MRDGQNNIKDMSKHIPKLKDGSKYIREETKRGFSFLKHFIIFPQEIREINKWGGVKISWGEGGSLQKS